MQCDELSDLSVTPLSLKTDEKVANVLEKTSRALLEKSNTLSAKLSALDLDTLTAAVIIGNASTKFQSLSDTQYMEKRVYTDDSDRLSCASKSSFKPVQTKEEKEKEVVDNFTRSLQLALTSLEEWRGTVETTSSVRDRPLPALIGSQDFYLKEDVGLGLYRTPTDEKIVPPDKPNSVAPNPVFTPPPLGLDLHLQRTPPSLKSFTSPHMSQQGQRDEPALNDLSTSTNRQAQESRVIHPAFDRPPKYTKDFDESLNNQRTQLFDDDVDENFRKVNPSVGQKSQLSTTPLPKNQSILGSDSDEDLFTPVPVSRKELPKKDVASSLRDDLEKVLQQKEKFHQREPNGIPTCIERKFTCCMGGWKAIRHVSLCDAPCCPGYVEKEVQPPLLKPALFCEKITQLMRERSKISNFLAPAYHKPELHHPFLRRNTLDSEEDTMEM